MTELESKERLVDLLIEESITGLSIEESRELAELKLQFPNAVEDDSIALSIAAIHLSSFNEFSPIPVEVERRILSNSRTSASLTNDSSKEEIRLGFLEFLSGRWLGWGVAACLAFALLITLIPNRITDDRELTISEQRDMLLASSDTLFRVAWSPGNVNEATRVSGDIVWNSSLQKGFMRFSGLPRNEVSKECYQLWIFDENQDEKTPVDGGIFNIEQDGEVIVPVKAKLNISKPVLFAVTIEKPGGVVVSRRDKIATLAKVGI